MLSKAEPCPPKGMLTPRAPVPKNVTSSGNSLCRRNQVTIRLLGWVLIPRDGCPPPKMKRGTEGSHVKTQREKPSEDRGRERGCIYESRNTKEHW